MQSTAKDDAFVVPRRVPYLCSQMFVKVLSPPDQTNRRLRLNASLDGDEENLVLLRYQCRDSPASAGSDPLSCHCSEECPQQPERHLFDTGLVAQRASGHAGFAHLDRSQRLLSTYAGVVTAALLAAARGLGAQRAPFEHLGYRFAGHNSPRVWGINAVGPSPGDLHVAQRVRLTKLRKAMEADAAQVSRWFDEYDELIQNDDDSSCQVLGGAVRGNGMINKEDGGGVYRPAFPLLGLQVR